MKDTHVYTHMAKKWSGMVVQRSFIKELSFVNRLYVPSQDPSFCNCSLKDVGSLEGGRGVQIADMGQFDGGRGKKEIQYRQFKIGKSGFFFVKMSKISDVFCGRPRP